jgi:hypothetical protein
MAIEDWIDKLVDVAGSVDAGNKKKVRAFYVFKKTEFPESITDFPCALTFTENVSMDYPDAGPNRDEWQGIIEFHITNNTKKSNYPTIMRYFSRIRTAFKANRILADNVILKLQGQNGPSIEGPVTLQYGDEQQHLGLLVHWIVRERYS